MKKRIILVGGGGHCRACIDVIESEGTFTIAGIVDVKEKLYTEVLGYEIIATDYELERLVQKYKYFLVTIGQIKSVIKRLQLFKRLKRLNVNLPVIISPLAYVSRHANIAEGTIVMHKTIINANVVVGMNSIINTSALLEHDTRIGDHCHISTGAIINGECIIGDRTFIGSNSVVTNNVRIAKDVVIGTGSVVTKSISKKGIYAGNPIRKVGKIA